MEVIRQHTNTLSVIFQSIENPDFNEAFLLIKSDNKEKLVPILRYVDRLLKLTFDTEESEIKPLHINFSTNLSYHERDLIAEYLLLKFHIVNLNYKSGDLEGLENEIKILANRVNNFSYPVRRTREYPNGISTTEYNQLVESHKKNKALLKFFKYLNKKLRVKLLFNSTIRQIQSLKNHFEYFPVAIELNDTTYSSNLLNSIKTLNEIDKCNSEIINSLESIILFDCDRKIIMTNYSYNEIMKWNSDYDSIFKNYLIITFGKEYQTINNVRNKIDLVRDRFKIPIGASYTILESEINFLLKRRDSPSVSIEFSGFETSMFWEEFLLETKVYDLYELRSIKLMNIYVLCFNEEIKNYILNQIFTNDRNCSIITLETKQEIFGLSESDIQNIKTKLSNTLDSIVNSILRKVITENLINEYKIVVDNLILKNTEFLNLVQRGLNVSSIRKFVSWDAFDDIKCSQIIILSYRDQGNFNHNFYPNIFENKVPENTNVKCILPAILYKQYYEWSKYSLLNDYHKMLNHAIRSNHFKWDELKKKIDELKPKRSMDISWDLENSYSASDTRVTYRFTFNDNSRVTCNPSDLFIYKQVGLDNPRIQNIRWIYEIIDIEETEIEVNNLDLLIDEFNPAEKLIDTTQQDSDLEIIRSQFGFKNESAGRLWKLLLARKIAEIGKVKLYEVLKDLFVKNSISIVSFSHFESTWINPESESLVPRGNKVFKVLCDYLKMPITYRRIIYTIKNKTINGKRNATRIYSKLLKDLFNDGCFDEEANPKQILSNRLEYYRSNHDLDELGIDEENPISGLLTLIELIIPELSYKKIVEVKKHEQ